MPCEIGSSVRNWWEHIEFLNDRRPIAAASSGRPAPSAPANSPPAGVDSRSEGVDFTLRGGRFQ
eukprot:7641101-Pyramimonas_sp.AAC.1